MDIMKKVLIIGPLPNPITGNSLANKIIYDNIEKYSSNYRTDAINTSYHKLEGHGNFSLRKVLFYTSLYKDIFKVLKADIVYITPGQTFYGVVKYAPFIYVARWFGKQIISHIHGNHLYQEYKNSAVCKKYIMRSILGKSNKGIVLSTSLKPNLTPFIEGKNIYILANFVEDILFTSVKKQADYLRILYVSNLMAEKGIFDLLDALLILQNSNIKFSAQIAGAMDEEHKAEIQAKLAKLANNVQYLGIIQADQKKQAFLSSNIFVFPTYYTMEGQPIAILEAMATGNIILTTQHAGIPDIFQEGMNGYYIEKKSPGDIAQKLIEIGHKLPSQANIMLCNQKIAAEKYRVEDFIKNFIHILED
jgi:glycosyltransferase involved in cell wall biosynthesis